MVNEGSEPQLGFGQLGRQIPNSPDLANLSHQFANVEVAETPLQPLQINFSDDLAEDSDASPNSARQTPGSSRGLGFRLGSINRRRTAAFSPVPKPQFSEYNENSPSGGNTRQEALELTPIRSHGLVKSLESEPDAELRPIRRGLSVRQNAPPSLWCSGEKDEGSVQTSLQASPTAHPQTGRKRSFSQSHQAGRRHLKHYRSDSCPPEQNYSEIPPPRPQSHTLPRSSAPGSLFLGFPKISEVDEQSCMIQETLDPAEPDQKIPMRSSSLSSISSSTSQPSLPPQCPRSFSVSHSPPGDQADGIGMGRRRHSSLRPTRHGGTSNSRQIRSQTMRALNGHLQLSRSHSWVGSETSCWLPIPGQTPGQSTGRGGCMALPRSPTSATGLGSSSPLGLSSFKHRELFAAEPVLRLDELVSIETQVRRIETIANKQTSPAPDPVPDGSDELASRRVVQAATVKETGEEFEEGLGRSQSSVLHAQTARASSGFRFFSSQSQVEFSMSQPSSRAASPLSVVDVPFQPPPVPCPRDSAARGSQPVLGRSLSVASSHFPSRRLQLPSASGTRGGSSRKSPPRRTAEEVSQIQKEQAPSLPHRLVKCCFAITAETMAGLLQGRYNSVFDKFLIIDCRYEFEYQGGHIASAINMTDRRQFEEFFKANCEANERVAIILHCEYSQVRGVKAWEFLRKLDRNKWTWPKLCLPQLFLLQGGYKEFYEDYPHLCTPRGYIPMTDERFEAQCKAAQRHRKKDWEGRRSREARRQ